MFAESAFICGSMESQSQRCWPANATLFHFCNTFC
jgi:hypothetical protein